MQVSKWGNSLAVRLPRSLVERMKLQPGDELRIVEAGEGRIEVEKAQHREAALARMAARGWRVPEGYRFDREEANAR